MNRGLAMAAVAWVVLGVAAGPALAGTTGYPPVAVQTATYTVQVERGQVSSLEIHPKTGGRLVAESFVNDAANRKDEAGVLPTEFCKTAACHSTCGYAQLARPFRQLSRYDANGRLVWSWRVKGEGGAIELLASTDTDCLSPDGRYLTVSIYRRGEDGVFSERMGPGVLDLDGPRFVYAKGLGSDKDAVVGWKPDAPSILIVEQDAGVEHSGGPRYRYSHPHP